MGTVYLVGAGPGDPELLSMKAYRLIKAADVILVDNLVLGVKTLIPADKQVIDVGKSWEEHKYTQEELNALIADLAGKYDTVVRLKGGDPYIFGRGGEEAVYLRERGIAVEVVPGITSAVAVPAAFGIPLTHRGVSSSVTFITGHEMEEKEEGLDWDAIARVKGTLVILMGVGNLAAIAATLMAYGRRAGTPVAVIEKGFTADERLVSGTLATIAEEASKAGVKPPAVIVIGEVVRLRETLR
jgi:uroporphyrin-III C-methyltransferase